MDKRQGGKRRGRSQENSGTGKWKWAAGSFLMSAALLLQLLARRVPGFAEVYARTIYPVLVRIIGGFFGLFPFSVVEFGLYALAIAVLWYGIMCIRRGIRTGFMRELARFFSSGFVLGAFLAFSYTANCGINYYRRPFSSYLDLNVRDSSADELEELCVFLQGCLVQAAGKVKAGRESLALDGQAKRELPRQAREDMKRLGERYPELAAFYPCPKPVAVSEILSLQSLSGVYAPFTIEANYNGDMAAYNIPHTACHELSHLKGFMREEEANFIGYLACIGSESPYSRYSGYAAGFIYANNALFAQKPETASRLQKELPKEVRSDFQENNEFWKRYEGKVSEAAARVNDTYLKANSQEDGVKSYGRMVDLMLAYYRLE